VQTNIAAQLTLEEAKWAAIEPITLPVPKTEAYFLSQTESVDSFPQIVTLWDRSRHGDQTGQQIWQTINQGGGHILSLSIIHRYNDPRKLRLILMRMSTAVRQILADDPDLGGVTMITKVNEEDPQPAFSAGNNQFEQAVEITMTAQTEEAI
jgi:hypothetical protein